MQNNSNMNIQSTVRKDTGIRNTKKYTNKNPLHQFVLGRFFDVMAQEIKELSPENVLEFGCGEGMLLQELKKRDVFFESLLGIDIREDAIRQARDLNPEYSFEKKDILQSGFSPKTFDMIIASEVLEHLIDPEPILMKLVELSSEYLLLTVPWEPWFRLMNFLRGRDIRRLGNHPEHINKWGVEEFVSLVNKYATVKNARTSFPFIIIVATT